MKAVVVYDSAYGNTEKIAQAIGRALGAPEDTETFEKIRFMQLVPNLGCTQQARQNLR